MGIGDSSPPKGRPEEQNDPSDCVPITSPIETVKRCGYLFSQCYVRHRTASTSLADSNLVLLDIGKDQAVGFDSKSGLPQTVSRRELNDHATRKDTHLRSLLSMSFQEIPFENNDQQMFVTSFETMIAITVIAQSLFSAIVDDSHKSGNQPASRDGTMPFGIKAVQELSDQAARTAMETLPPVWGIEKAGWDVRSCSVTSTATRVTFHSFAEPNTRTNRHWQMFFDPTSPLLVDWFDSDHGRASSVLNDPDSAVEMPRKVCAIEIIEATAVALFIFEKASKYISSEASMTEANAAKIDLYHSMTKDVLGDEKAEEEALTASRQDFLGTRSAQLDGHMVAISTHPYHPATQDSSNSSSAPSMTDTPSGDSGGAVVLSTRSKASRNKKKPDKKITKKQRDRAAAAAEAATSTSTSTDTEDTGYESEIDVQGPTTHPSEEIVSSSPDQEAVSDAETTPKQTDRLTKLPSIVEEDETTPTKAANTAQMPTETSETDQAAIPTATSPSITSSTPASATAPAQPSPSSFPAQIFHFDNFHPETRCRNPDCRQATHPLDGKTKICPACGPRSKVRYCSKECLYLDIRRHYLNECGTLALGPEVSVDMSTVDPANKNVRPYIVVTSPNMVQTVERHRQAVWFAMEEEGEYYIFDDVDAGGYIITDMEDMQELRGRGAMVWAVHVTDDVNRGVFRGVLIQMLSEGVNGDRWEQYCLAVFGAVKLDLMAHGEWDTQMCTYLCMQMGFESQYRVPESEQV